MDQDTSERTIKSKQNLPQTGENITIVANITGILIFFAISFIKILKRRK